MENKLLIISINITLKTTVALKNGTLGFSRMSEIHLLEDCVKDPFDKLCFWNVFSKNFFQRTFRDDLNLPMGRRKGKTRTNFTVPKNPGMS